MMDETRMRAVIREEIALAVKTLAEQMWSSDPEDTGASFEQAASSFGIYAYRGACEAADAEREAATNPFAPDLTMSPEVADFILRDVSGLLWESCGPKAYDVEDPRVGETGREYDNDVLLRAADIVGRDKIKNRDLLRFLEEVREVKPE